MISHPPTDVFHDDFEKVLVLVTHEEVVFVGLEFDHALGLLSSLLLLDIITKTMSI